jgi:hypothetical protein
VLRDLVGLPEAIPDFLGIGIGTRILGRAEALAALLGRLRFDVARRAAFLLRGCGRLRGGRGRRRGLGLRVGGRRAGERAEHAGE